MCKLQRAPLLIRLLAGWHRQRDPDLWTVPCRDGCGRRTRLHVHLTVDGVVLDASSPGPWVLTPLEAGRLRGAVRDALFTYDRLISDENCGGSFGARTMEPASPQPVGELVSRQRDRLAPTAEPRTAEITSHINYPVAFPSEADYDHLAGNPTVKGGASVAE